MSSTSNQPDQSGNGAVIDWAAALEATGGDQSLLGELVDLFLQEGRTLMADIRRSIEEGDTELLRRSAHTLKGSLRIFESDRAIDLAFQMEQIGKNEELEQAPEVLEQLAPQMELVVAELQRYGHTMSLASPAKIQCRVSEVDSIFTITNKNRWK